MLKIGAQINVCICLLKIRCWETFEKVISYEGISHAIVPEWNLRNGEMHTDTVKGRAFNLSFSSWQWYACYAFHVIITQLSKPYEIIIISFFYLPTWQINGTTNGNNNNRAAAAAAALKRNFGEKKKFPTRKKEEKKMNKFFLLLFFAVIAVVVSDVAVSLVSLKNMIYYIFTSIFFFAQVFFLWIGDDKRRKVYHLYHLLIYGVLHVRVKGT